LNLDTERLHVVRWIATQMNGQHLRTTERRICGDRLMGFQRASRDDVQRGRREAYNLLGEATGRQQIVD